jgi:hypothetical protein
MTAARKILISIAAGIALASFPVRAADERPEIAGVRLHARGSDLVCDVRSRGLIGEKISGTVRSGLPAVVELFYHVKGRGRDVSIKGLHTWSLEYDVWEDRYTVSAGDSVVVVDSIESMRGIIENVKAVSLVPLARLAGVKSISARVSIAVNPLSGSESRRLSGWVDESVRGGRDNSWREQVLNVSELISHFFQREGKRADRSGWFETDWIKWDELISSGGEDR